MALTAEDTVQSTWLPHAPTVDGNDPHGLVRGGRRRPFPRRRRTVDVALTSDPLAG